MRYIIEWSINEVADSIETESPKLTALIEGIWSIQACSPDEITIHAIDENGDLKPGSLHYLTTHKDLREFIKEVLDSSELL